MRMALVKVALATTVGVVTLAACGSANDGYDPSIATAVGYVSGSNQSGNTGDPLPELLTVKTNLNRVWILRRLLQEMNPVDAMEFIMDKIRKCDNNQLFLDSMNQ